jgi:hypothetical protein
MAPAAVLRSDNNAHARRRSCALVQCRAPSNNLAPPTSGEPPTANRRVRCYRCPPEIPTCTWNTEAKVSGPLKTHWLEVHDESKAGSTIQQGFSGSPAFADTRADLIGMVAADRNLRLSYLIPIDLLRDLESWKDWNGPPPQLPRLVEPYKGLATFQEEDARHFFGRIAFKQELRKRTSARPVTLVVGASGSGKSSVVFAGLLPELRRVGGWAIAHFRPGEMPLNNLTHALPTLQSSNTSINERAAYAAAQLREDPARIHQWVGDIIASLNGVHRLLLFGDQFEQLYTPAQ